MQSAVEEQVRIIDGPFSLEPPLDAIEFGGMNSRGYVFLVLEVLSYLLNYSSKRLKFSIRVILVPFKFLEVGFL